MKNLFFAAIAAGAMFIAPALKAAEPMPYKSDIGVNGGVAPGWTHSTTTGHEWEYDDRSDFSTPETAGGMRHTYESPASDAMLISPAFAMTAGTTYTAGFWVKTSNGWSSDVEAFKFFMGTEPTQEALKLAEPLFERED